jgi:hypothetical protein
MGQEGGFQSFRRTLGADEEKEYKMRWLRLYVIDGFPSIVVSYRPKDALHTIKRVYYKLSGATVRRFFIPNPNILYFTYHDTGTEVMIVELKGGTNTNRAASLEPKAVTNIEPGQSNTKKERS